MAIITLTTDWGLENHYLGAVKGSLLKLLPDARIIDISHQLPPFDIMQASFVLKNAYPHFPKGSIHLLGVNSEAGMETPHVAIRHQDHFFIGSDNGVFSLMFDNNPDEAIEIDVIQDSEYFTFSTRDVFAKVASMIASGKKLSEIGKPHSGLFHRIPFMPVVYPEKIIGKVIFIDNYENVFVNITRELFRHVGKGRSFSINYRSAGEGITEIHQAYGDVTPGEKMALFGSTTFMEIAINQGKASSLLGLHLNDTVSIIFNNQD
jgi:S-adenosyl-L-methionine hydrolase (adenosine-forming)